MGSFFNRFYRYLNFSASKNRFFKTRLKATYISETAPKLRFLMGFFFCNFLGINTQNFVKNNPKFDATCYGA